MLLVPLRDSLSAEILKGWILHEGWVFWFRVNWGESSHSLSRAEAPELVINQEGELATARNSPGSANEGTSGECRFSIIQELLSCVRGISTQKMKKRDGRIRKAANLDWREYRLYPSCSHGLMR